LHYAITADDGGKLSINENTGLITLNTGASAGTYNFTIGATLDSDGNYNGSTATSISSVYYIASAPPIATFFNTASFASNEYKGRLYIP
jgi:hypothetical protein